MDKTFRLVKTFRLALMAFALGFVVCEAVPAYSEPDSVVLNASRVSYNDETGQASAQGQAVLNYRGMTIEAERIDYDAASQKIEAMPLPNQKVTIKGAGKTLQGDHLDYDLETREGILSGARTGIAAGEGTLYVYGGEIDILPWETAVERGIVGGKTAVTPADYAAQWREVTLTTCTLDHPHYRLEAKSITFIPGRCVIARKPRLYLGNTYIFTFPLDYVVQLQRRAVKYSMIPYIQRSSSRGAGGGVNGTAAWETGTLSLGLAWADKIGFEGMLELEQQLGPEFSLTVGSQYTWDEAWDDTIWRPYAALKFERKGWIARLRWVKDEYIEDQKDFIVDYKGRLDRRAEFSVLSPWFAVSPYSWLGFGVSWGSYNEEVFGRGNNVADRYGVELRSYFEKTLSRNVSFFSNTAGYAFFYDKAPRDQEVLWSFTGLRYNIGSVELGTGYEKQKVWGDGPMFWDKFRERERIHQKIRFPIGREFYVAARGSYDLDQSVVDQVIYNLQWVVDCMMVDLHFKDDRTSGGDNQVGLSLSLLAWPDTPASIGQRLEKDPFNRPADLPKK